MKNQQKELLKALLRRLLAELYDPKVLNFGSGTCVDIHEFLTEMPNSEMQMDCLEEDPEATGFARKLNESHTNYLSFIQQGVLDFQTNKKYDFIWSRDSLDKVEDEVFIQLLQRFGGWLQPGGAIAISCCDEEDCKNTSSRRALDVCLEYRNENKLKELAYRAGYNTNQVTVVNGPKSPDGAINLLLIQDLAN